MSTCSARRTSVERILMQAKSNFALRSSSYDFFTWEDSTCFVSECSSSCLDFPLLVLLNMSERNMLLYSVLFLRVFGNNLFMSYSQVGQYGSRSLEKRPL